MLCLAEDFVEAGVEASRLQVDFANAGSAVGHRLDLLHRLRQKLGNILRIH